MQRALRVTSNKSRHGCDDRSAHDLSAARLSMRLRDMAAHPSRKIP